MKKKFLACMLIMMLTITGCSSKSITQTLFVEKNNKYALCTLEGDLKTKFIYSSYKKVENEGYVVIHDKKYEYISTTGKKLIKYKKGTTLSVVENMIVAKDAKGKYTIYDQQGKELYKDSKKVKIYMYDLPVIYKNKKYSVLNSEGEVVTTSKKAINYAGIYHDSFITVAYKDKTVLFDTSSNSQIDEEGLTIKLKGQYKVVANDYKKGFILYDQQQINLAYVNLKGKVKFEKNVEVDSVKFKDSSLILKNEDGIRLLSLDGKKDVVATSYYKDVNNYLSKNASYIYGPHNFTKDGKEKDVKGIGSRKHTGKEQCGICICQVQACHQAVVWNHRHMAGNHHRGNKGQKQHVSSPEIQPGKRIGRNRGHCNHAKRNCNRQKNGVDDEAPKRQHFKQPVVVVQCEGLRNHIQRAAVVQLFRCFERRQDSPNERINHGEAKQYHQNVICGVPHSSAHFHAHGHFLHVHSHSPPCSRRKRNCISVNTRIRAKKIHARAEA